MVILDTDHLSFLEWEESSPAQRLMGTMDQRIAAIALVHKAKVLSRNIKDFAKVPGLIVEDWTR